jgi:hypothetical protein
MGKDYVSAMFGSPYGSHSHSNYGNKIPPTTTFVKPSADREAHIFNNQGYHLSSEYLRSLNPELADKVRRTYNQKNPNAIKGGAKKKKNSLENRTKDELIQTAKKRGCKCNNNMKKSEIIAMLRH